MADCENFNPKIDFSDKNLLEDVHWADKTADLVIKRNPFNNLYTCASGITPSGTVHIGNFREIISTSLVVRALQEKGKQVRFIYSWDDYDVFRKVPANMPRPDYLKGFLRFPITSVPDTSSKNTSSYARMNELDIEDDLQAVGIHPEYIYQADRYKTSYYAGQIQFALRHRGEIRDILNKYRTENYLDESWWPISVFSSFTGKDTTTIIFYDGEWTVRYRDDETKQEEDLDLRKTGLVKLNWRIDWPMRWAEEHVNFEPAGKDHHSSGGSFDTSREIVSLFGAEAPLSFQYDFISIKGHGGKISSSSGDVVSLGDVLEIYTPEVTRFMFAKTRPNSEFAISFDTDVFKIYEDYENTERIYFGLAEADAGKAAKDKRIYELSQPGRVPSVEGYQVSFRHLCSLLTLNNRNIDKTIESLGNVKKEQRYRLRQKARCALNWMEKYADDEFKWTLSTASTPMPVLKEDELLAVQEIALLDDQIDKLDEKELSSKIYEIAQNAKIEPKALFRAAYLVLIGKERGPRLAGFLKSLGSAKVAEILLR